MPVAVPRKPTVEIFHPFTSKARVCSTRYIDPGTHADTNIKVWRVDPKLVIVDTNVGAQDDFTLQSLNLVAGELYRCRVRYQNETGWGGWSPNRYARVPKSSTYAAIAVPTEPQVGGTIPTEPSFVARVNRRRGFHQWNFETAHIARRPMMTDERLHCQMQWTNVSTAEADALIAFLDARLEAVGGPEAFATTNPHHGARNWFPRHGTLERWIHDLASGGGTFSVAIEVDQAIGARPFTVEESVIGGPDEVS